MKQLLVKKDALAPNSRLLIGEPRARLWGLGKHLVEECVQFAREVGFMKITLWTQSHLLAARDLQESGVSKVEAQSRTRNKGCIQLRAKGAGMKPLFWVGLIVLILGVASFFVALPHQEKHGISVGDASVGITTRDDQKAPAWLSATLVIGGIALMAVGGKRK